MSDANSPLPSTAAASVDGRPQRFHTTVWNIVLQAAAGDQQGRQALATLCEAYWYPLYVYVRRRGIRSEDAEDTVQSFFAWFLEQNLVSRADPARGRFRAFLLAALKQFLIRQHEYASAAKRRPEQPLVSIHGRDSEHRYCAEPLDHLTPEREYDRNWALALIDRALQRLSSECDTPAKAHYFQCFAGLLKGQSQQAEQPPPEQLGLNDGAVRVGVHRLKRRYRELLRDEVSQTLDSSEDVDDELGRLLAALDP